MRSIRVPLCALLLLASGSIDAADTAAIVDRVEGVVTVKRDAKAASLSALDEVGTGQVIDVPAGSTLVLIALASGAELTFAGPAQVSFDASGAPVVKGGSSPRVRTPNRASPSDVRVRPSSVAQAALVMRAAEMAVPRSANDILALLDAHRPDPALLKKNQAILDRPIPADASKSDRIAAHRARAFAAEALALGDVQIAELRAALADMEPDSMATWHVQHELFHALRLRGSFAEAIRIKQGALGMRSRQNGARITDALMLAEIYADSGNLDEARAMLQQAQELVGRMSNVGFGGRRGRGSRARPSGLDRAERATYHGANLARTTAVVLMAEGKYQDAEEMFRRARDLREETLRSGDLAVDEDVSIERHLGTLDRAEQGISQALAMQGRLIEAEYWARQVVVRVLERLGPESTRSVHFVRVLAGILNEQGRFADSEKLLRWALATLEMNGTSQDSHTYGEVLYSLATSEVGQGRFNEAAGHYDQLRKALASQPELAVKLLKSVAWAQALYQTGRAEEAVALMEWEVREREKMSASKTDRLLAEMRGFYGIALHRAGRNAKALEQFSVAVPVLIGWRAVASDEQGGAAGQVRRTRLIIDEYIELLFDMRDAYAGGRDAARDEAFRVSDYARDRTTQVALVAAASRASADTPELAGAVRELQDVEQRLAAAGMALERQLGLPDNGRDRRSVDGLRAVIRSLESEHASLAAAIERRFPAYADLTTPRPASVENARRLLRDGEAIVNVLVGPRRTHVWIVPKSGAVRWEAVPLGDDEARSLVGALRNSVDPGDVTIDRLPEFDLAAASRLYELLLKPFEADLAGARTLIVVANGALAEIPFGVLVTRPATLASSAIRFGGYRNVEWLARRVAIAQLPAVNTFVTLRSLPPITVHRAAYAGFGDPQFGAVPAARLPGDAVFTTRNLALRRVSEGSADAGWIPYGDLPPLPDTREEVITLAVALHADPVGDVFLGAAASKANLREADLAHRRIVAFATHGLLAGDFAGLDQPALALASDNDPASGLLTLEDILGLKMDADLVVLSACNSGAGGGNGAEAISGLGRGFFYAGARSLLVTHWPVETRAARKLVTEVFKSYSADATITRAEALRRGMIAVMDGPPALDPQTQQPLYSYAHPIFWAPYSLIGDGGR